MKKKLLVSALAIALVAIIAVGSLAYFTASTSVTNVFKTTSTDPDQELFDVDVIEPNADGEENEFGGHTYEDIVPGSTYAKDPTVVNTGVYGAYVRVSVTVTKASAWQAIFAKWDLDLDDVFGGFDARFERKSESYDADADTLTYVYYLNEELVAGASATLFQTVTIPAVLDNDDMASISEFDLTVTADAIQAQNTGDNAVDAFANYWD